MRGKFLKKDKCLQFNDLVYINQVIQVVVNLYSIKVCVKLIGTIIRREGKMMETVFAKGLTEKEVKSYNLCGDLLAKGEICPFLSKFHIETGSKSFLPSRHSKYLHLC